MLFSRRGIKKRGLDEMELAQLGQGPPLAEPSSTRSGAIPKDKYIDTLKCVAGIPNNHIIKDLELRGERVSLTALEHNMIIQALKAYIGEAGYLGEAGYNLGFILFNNNTIVDISNELTLMHDGNDFIDHAVQDRRARLIVTRIKERVECRKKRSLSRIFVANKGSASQRALDAAKAEARGEGFSVEELGADTTASSAACDHR